MNALKVCLTNNLYRSIEWYQCKLALVVYVSSSFATPGFISMFRRKNVSKTLDTGVWSTCVNHQLILPINYAKYWHDDVIKWKYFPRYWPFVRGIPGLGEFPAQRPVTRSFDVFFDLYLNKRLSKQSWGWWFETLSCPLWRHCNGAVTMWPGSPLTEID